MKKYMNFSIKEPKEKGIKPGLPLFMDSVHFSNTL